MPLKSEPSALEDLPDAMEEDGIFASQAVFAPRVYDREAAFEVGGGGGDGGYQPRGKLFNVRLPSLLRSSGSLLPSCLEEGRILRSLHMARFPIPRHERRESFLNV